MWPRFPTESPGRCNTATASRSTRSICRNTSWSRIIVLRIIFWSNCGFPSAAAPSSISTRRPMTAWNTLTSGSGYNLPCQRCSMSMKPASTSAASDTGCTAHPMPTGPVSSLMRNEGPRQWIQWGYSRRFTASSVTTIGSPILSTVNFMPCATLTISGNWRAPLNRTNSNGPLRCRTCSKRLTRLFFIPAPESKRYRKRYRTLLAEADKECPAPKETERQGSRGKLPRSKARNLLERLRDYENEVLRFMDEPDVPFSNNQAENDIRMTKVQQKISGCFRSWDGALIFCRIRSYLSTCRKQGITATEALTLLFDGKSPDFMASG